jgi:limonene-1,2-epoxide hydrolase
MITSVASNDPSRIVTAFVEALNRRDLGAARDLMAQPSEMVFPGSAVFDDIERFFEWAKIRYRYATYRYDRLDTIDAGERAIVYAVGSIAGEMNDGETFSAVRVLDRFEIEGGKIVRKEAWSDMADFLRRKGK